MGFLKYALPFLAATQLAFADCEYYYYPWILEMEPKN